MISEILKETCDIDIHTNSNGESIEIAIPRDGSPVAVFISGGCDSAIMTYMVVKSIQKFGYGNKVYPMTSEFLQRPFNIKYSWQVLRKIEELTGFKFAHHLIFPMPNHSDKISDEDKKPIMSYYIDDYFEKYGLKTMFNGLTANPPIEDVPDDYYGKRQSEREDIEFIKSKRLNGDRQYPLIFSDKKSVASFYHKYELIDILFPLTRSCESEMEESDYFTKTCFDVRKAGTACWWCREREYGFSEYRPMDFIFRRLL